MSKLEEAYERVYIKNRDCIQQKEKIRWIDYFFGLAFTIAEKSPDAQTRHGAIIIDRQNRIIGCGYNGFPTGLPDDALPNLRPKKYKWMIHAEENCLLNCAIPPSQLVGGGILIVSGRPCLKCASLLINSGVKTWYVADRQGSVLETDEEDEYNFLTKFSNVDIHIIRPNLNFMTETNDKLRKLGFITD